MQRGKLPRITSLSACSKVFEIIVNSTLFSCCKRFISDDQHGFFPKRSVATNLVEFVSLCLRSLDSGSQVDAIYTDLKAAFDRVDHGILLRRLEILGVSPALVSWLQSYLTGRKLQVKIGSSHSAPFASNSGVPQGSNLGPLLFTLYVNEVSSILPPGCRLLYADDVKIYKIIKSISDCSHLQQLVDVFQAWCSRNMLTISITKCSAISFHRKQNPLMHDYKIFGNSLTRVSFIKDLGVTLDRELTFRSHYSELIAKGNKQLGFVCKIASEFRDPTCLRTLYCSLVRPILEASSVVWCPYQDIWISKIEAVQKKFVRYALRYLPWRNPQELPAYENRCRLLGLETLQTRRRAAQAVFVAKMFLGEIDSPAILADLNLYAPERVMRQRALLQLAARNTGYGLHEPVRAMSDIFNQCFNLFDFNLSASSFNRRLRTSNTMLNRP